MISTLEEAQDLTMQRCLALIEKRGPRLLRAGGGALEGERVVLTSEQRGDMVEERRGGALIAALAKKYRISETVVTKICVEAGVNGRVLRSMTFSGLRGQVLALVMQGKPYKEIAAEVGVSVKSVTTWASQAGMERRRMKMTPQLEQRMRSLLEQGKSVRVVSQEMGCSEQCVRNQIKKFQASAVVRIEAA